MEVPVSLYDFLKMLVVVLKMEFENKTPLKRFRSNKNEQSGFKPVDIKSRDTTVFGN